MEPRNVREDFDLNISRARPPVSFARLLCSRAPFASFSPTSAFSVSFSFPPCSLRRRRRHDSWMAAAVDDFDGTLLCACGYAFRNGRDYRYHRAAMMRHGSVEEHRLQPATAGTAAAGEPANLAAAIDAADLMHEQGGLGQSDWDEHPQDLFADSEEVRARHSFLGVSDFSGHILNVRVSRSFFLSFLRRSPLNPVAPSGKCSSRKSPAEPAPLPHRGSRP